MYFDWVLSNISFFVWATITSAFSGCASLVVVTIAPSICLVSSNWTKNSVINPPLVPINVISGLVVGSMLRYSDTDVDLDLNKFVDKVYESLLKIAN